MNRFPFWVSQWRFYLGAAIQSFIDIVRNIFQIGTCLRLCIFNIVSQLSICTTKTEANKTEKFLILVVSSFLLFPCVGAGGKKRRREEGKKGGRGIEKFGDDCEAPWKEKRRKFPISWTDVIDRPLSGESRCRLMLISILSGCMPFNLKWWLTCPFRLLSANNWIAMSLNQIARAKSNCCECLHVA